MKAKNESPVCFDVRGRQRLVENTVNFVFGGFGVPAETYLLKRLLFSEYIYFKSFVKFLFMQRAQDCQARRHHSLTVNLAKNNFKKSKSIYN